MEVDMIMMKSAKKIVFLVGTVVLLSGGLLSCKETSSGQDQTHLTTENSLNTTDFVFVYKYDGSLQCGEAKAIDLKVHAKELSKAKIFILEQKNLSDGVMRVMACGTPTGQANVFKIKAADEPQALKLGFQRWEY